MEHEVSRPHPIPMQDELAIGILGRFARMNAIPSLDLAARTINSQTNARNPNLLWLLAEVCGKSAREFSLKHSLLPVLCPILKGAENPSFNGGDLFSESNRAMNCLLGHIRWCQECCQNDIDNHHFSYWRRLHQIVGLERCPHHLTPLVQTSQKFAINNPGHPATIATVSKPLTATKPEMENSVFMRMQEIIIGLLQRSCPIAVKAWLNVVRVRCDVAGLRIPETGNFPVVSNLIRESFPSNWLTRYIPLVARKSPNTFIREIDGACISKRLQYPTLVYASILSVLFDSSEQALHALDAANLQAKSLHQEMMNETSPLRHR